MAEIFKPDDLVRRVADLERRLSSQEASGRRGIWHADYIASDTISGGAYGFGAPTITVQPGPTGLLLVGITANIYALAPGVSIACSFVLTNGPTAFGGDDDHALILENGNGNADIISGAFTRWVLSPPLGPGVYYLTWAARAPLGGSIDVEGRGITAIAM